MRRVFCLPAKSLADAASAGEDGGCVQERLVSLTNLIKKESNMKKAENSKSLMLGVPGILLQMVGYSGAQGASEEVAPLCILLQLAGTVLLIWGLWYYAKAKDRAGYWGFCGLLSILGLIILACLRDEHQETPDAASKSTADLNTDPTPPEDQ